MKCHIDGCDSESYYKAAQLCAKHYHRIRRNGSVQPRKKGFRAFVEASLPGTCAEIAEKAGVDRSTVHAWIGKIREDGLSHIGSWQRTTPQITVAVHVPGPGKDAKRPRNMTKAESCALWRKRNKEKVESQNAKKRAAWHANKIVKQHKTNPATWLSALGV